MPGLSSVLSFASLSVRPALYSLFEDYIVALPTADLRPALKSILLGLLPAIEEETSEDFDRAFKIVQSFERKFSGREGKSDLENERSGYFWQCLFLCVITSPTRRQGALNFLTRQLPKFGVSHEHPYDVHEGVHSGLAGLSPEAEAAVSPEPGLLIRCFMAGLCDPQVLTQRGFLDLLVTHLPLHSPVLRDRVAPEDLDRLVSATLQVLLRREMSLNRRLWAWFLGPSPKGTATDSNPPSPADTEQESSLAPGPWLGSQYFEVNGKASLIRCILQMFRAEVTTPSQMARPYRICLSLMDRWEIGGLLIPPVLLPALENVYACSLVASPHALSEVLRSASLFFDGVEASLLWACLNSLLRDARGDLTKDPDRLHMFIWIAENFNIKDEEMVTVHIPLTTLHLLGLLNAQEPSLDLVLLQRLVMDIVSLLIESIPSGAVEESDHAVEAREASAILDSDWTSNAITRAVSAFYEDGLRASSRPAMPFAKRALAIMLQRMMSFAAARALSERSFELFCQTVPPLHTLVLTIPCVYSEKSYDLQQAISAVLDEGERGLSAMPFPALASIITVLSMWKAVDRLPKADVLASEAALASSLWRSLSSSTPKYHVEAVKSFWNLEDLVAPEDGVKVSLLALTCSARASDKLFDADAEETIRRFMVLWNHTIPGQPSNNRAGAFGLPRRGSAMPSMSEMVQAVRRQSTLREPLLLVLDQLCNPSNAGFGLVKAWVSTLPSLGQVLTILLECLAAYASSDVPRVPDERTDERQDQERKRLLEYYLTHFKNLLACRSDWIWQCLQASPAPAIVDGETANGFLFLAQTSIDVLCAPVKNSTSLHQTAVAVLDTILNGPVALELKSINLDVIMIDRLISSLQEEDGNLQGLLLRLTVQAINLHVKQMLPEPAEGHGARGSIGVRRPSVSITGSTFPATTMTPPPQLFQCICLGFSSPCAHYHMDQWLDFLASVLPTFADAIFGNLLPLVDCFCRELRTTFDKFVALSHVTAAPSVTAPESVMLALLEGLEMVLARGHECLVADAVATPMTKQTTQPNSFLGNVASGVFKAEGPPSKTAQANSRLTVILAFQDVIRVCFRMWNWSAHHTDNTEYDKTSAATTAYCALRIRNKTRHLLEQMFAVEPLESLEVIIARWKHAPQESEAAAAVNLLQVMQGTRPKNILPAILDALCSRANPAVLSAAHQSTQTTDLTALDVTLFLLAYITFTEDDAMDEVWDDCIAFLRDVLANPLPYRLILPALLSVILLLAEKLGNTNFGEQRKMRRELGDVFSRVLAATFTTLPSGFAYEPATTAGQPSGSSPHEKSSARSSSSLSVVLKNVVVNIEVILETAERTSTAINSIIASVTAALFHAKSFPRNIDSDSLDLLLECAKKAPSSKVWKKEVSEVFNHPRLLMSPANLMQDHWFPILHQWCLRDKDKMPDQLSRLAPPSSAGIMFGVGASAARLEADRKTQLTVRRTCLLLLASPEDTFAVHLKDFEEKLVELFEATDASSPSAAVKAELFLWCRVLLLSLNATNLSPLWPVINDNLRAAFASLLPATSNSKAFTNLGLLQACKLIDQLVALSPDEFQLHEWLYITDTIDAVYQQSDGASHALADQVADALATDGTEDNDLAPHIAPATAHRSSGYRRQLLGGELPVDKGDLKAMTREDFARAVVRPVLSQLSMHAYEGVYSMDAPDLVACRRDVLEDVLDLSTIVE